MASRVLLVEFYEVFFSQSSLVFETEVLWRRGGLFDLYTTVLLYIHEVFTLKREICPSSCIHLPIDQESK